MGLQPIPFNHSGTPPHTPNRHARRWADMYLSTSQVNAKKAKFIHGNTFMSAPPIYRPLTGQDCITNSAVLYAVPWQGASDQADGTAAGTQANGGKVGLRAGQASRRHAVAAAIGRAIGYTASTRWKPPAATRNGKLAGSCAPMMPPCPLPPGNLNCGPRLSIAAAWKNCCRWKRCIRASLLWLPPWPIRNWIHYCPIPKAAAWFWCWIKSAIPATSALFCVRRRPLAPPA